MLPAARPRLRGDRRARRHLHAALRRDPPGPAGARAGPGRARRGVPIFERTPAMAIRPRPIRGSTPAGHATVRQDADEYGRRSWFGPPRATRATLPGLRRRVAPLYSLMIATEPLPAVVLGRCWAGASRETFSDFRHLIIYGQRTADDRLAFGGRGAPYHFGSVVRADVRPRAARARAAPRHAARAVPGHRASPDHPRLGRTAWRRPRLDAPRSASTGGEGWPGRAATSATASARPTWPAERLPTSSAASAAT